MDKPKAHPKTFRAVVLACGTLLAILFLVILVPKIISGLRGIAPDLSPGQQWEGQVMLAMFVTFMVGYLIGWWWSLWGGLLMIVAALLVSVPFALKDNYGSLIFGIPQFVIGILYILLSRMKK